MKNIFIISGPSGVGEDSIIKGLKKILPIEVIITTTTRDLRPGESQGNPYYFISKEEFKNGIENNEFFEYAKEYNDNYYGVTHKEIERIKNSDKIGIWKIEYKGVIYAKKMFPNIIAIFINAPLDILEKRIRNRSNVSEEYIKERLDYTREWLKNIDIYNYKVENEEGKLKDTIKKVANIIEKNYIDD
ncbi:guanylate kinase [Candidatus Parcubacteria bacterium]|nr:MAG: guanylate kinase [Candidatus Parcubacteria bacterium]